MKRKTDREREREEAEWPHTAIFFFVISQHEMIWIVAINQNTHQIRPYQTGSELCFSPNTTGDGGWGRVNLAIRFLYSFIFLLDLNV